MDLTIVLSIIGIIAAITIGIWQILLARKQLRNSNSHFDNNRSDLVVNNDAVYMKTPLPSEIVDQINKLPFGQKDAARNSYVGIKVQWQTTLKVINTIHPMKIDLFHLMLLDRGSYPWVICEVVASQYPELKILNEGHQLWVSGEINKIEGGVIYLTNCKLRTN